MSTDDRYRPQQRYRGAPMQGGQNLADILERVLDKGIVIAGDITINLLDIELLNIKLRLLKETAHVPELALGFRDLGGTGLFSSEYLVASKRWYDVDLADMRPLAVGPTEGRALRPACTSSPPIPELSANWGATRSSRAASPLERASRARCGFLCGRGSRWPCAPDRPGGRG